MPQMAKNYTSALSDKDNCLFGVHMRVPGKPMVFVLAYSCSLGQEWYVYKPITCFQQAKLVPQQLIGLSISKYTKLSSNSRQEKCFDCFFIHTET
jgi:hypothetical protein